MISVTVNGKPRSFQASLSVPDLLSALEINPRLVAVAVNGEVIPRAVRASTTVQDGDEVEIVRAVGGGAA